MIINILWWFSSTHVYPILYRLLEIRFFKRLLVIDGYPIL